MPDENTLTLDYNDGAQELRLTNGGWCIEHGKIAISIETESEDGDCAMFCIFDFPIQGELAAADVFECEGGMFADDAGVEGAVQANAYFGFHAEYVFQKWIVVEVRSNCVLFRIEAKLDEDANENHAVGLFSLPKKAMDQLWIPV